MKSAPVEIYRHFQTPPDRSCPVPALSTPLPGHERVTPRACARRKRLLDIGASLTLGLLLSPVIVVVAAVVGATSRGPVVYGHRRRGLHGRSIRVWKFRTMVVDADRRLEEVLAADPVLRTQWEADHKLDPDPRVTLVGRILRSTSLDELPQLWNVLRGDMSLVGPRPIVDDEVPRYGECMETVFAVLPGVTGLWQVSGRNDTTYEERVSLDHRYASQWTFRQDIEILLRTPAAVVARRGAR